MNPEEIEKAAEKEYLANPDYSVKELVNTFTAGAKFANKIWQEKTKWILVSERLPEIRETPYWIVVKNDEFDERVSIKIKDSNFIAYIKLYYKEWREIE